MNRPDRLLSIVLELQEHAWQRAEDLADLFDVSTRTIYRDMQALGEGGVPLKAVPGKGYRLYEDFFLPPLLFTTDEALVLLLGGEQAAHQLDEAHQAAARRARRKIAAVLPETLLDEAATLRERLHSAPLNVFDDPQAQVLLERVRRALAEQRVVRFRYEERAGALGEEETVDPYGLVHGSGGWDLVGSSRTRGVRAYRLRSMADLTVLEETFDRPAGYRPPRADDVAPPEVTVRVSFDREAARWVRERPSAFALDLEERADGLVATLKVRREAEALPWLLGFGAHVCVLEPASLRRRLAREAGEMVARYRTDLRLLP